MHAVGATGIFQIVEAPLATPGTMGKFHADPKMWERFGRTRPENFRVV